MDKSVNDLLATVRRRLEENLASIGPINAVTEPEPGAEVDEVIDELDNFMAESARYLARETGLDEDEALDFCFDLAEAGEEAQILPEFPSEGASSEAVAAWLDAAENTGFVLQAITQVKEQLDERAKSDPTLTLMTKIDNAPYHAMHPDKLSDAEKAHADALVKSRLLSKNASNHPRFPDHYTVSGGGGGIGHLLDIDKIAPRGSPNNGK